jgi:hypothetical protein
LPAHEPAPSPAAKSRGVSRVKGFERRILRNLGGTTGFPVPLWTGEPYFFADGGAGNCTCIFQYPCAVLVE